MTEKESKAIKWIKNVKDDAMVTLDHIAKNEPNVSPMLYTGRKEKAETIIKGFEELEQYRAIGTVRECQQARERQRGKKPLEAIQHQKKVGYRHRCSRCGCAVGYVEKNLFRRKILIEHAARYCHICGQAIKWEEGD